MHGRDLQDGRDLQHGQDGKKGMKQESKSNPVHPVKLSFTTPGSVPRRQRVLRRGG
jgi:hypothetical protein